MTNFSPDVIIGTCKLVRVGAVESKPNGDDTVAACLSPLEIMVAAESKL